MCDTTSIFCQIHEVNKMMGNNNYNQDPSDSSYTNRVATNNNHRDDRFDHPIFSALSTSKIPPEAFQRAALANAPFALGTTARGFTNATGNNTSKQTKAFAAHKNQQNAFLYELFDIVSDPINKDIISWLSHGRGFIINNKNLFEKNILPHFLPNTKYASFTRRLKRWKFTRVPSGVEMGAYYHQNFQRGKEQLVHHINTNEAPLLNPEAGSGTLPASVSPTMASHKKLFAKIKIPPSSVGRSTSAPEDLAASTSPAAASAAATGDGNTFRDVRDFPQIMREISKAKRLESIAARRKDDFTSVDANNNRPHFYWDDALTSSIMNQPLVALPPSPEPLPYQQQQQTSLLQQQQQQQEIQLLDQRESSYQRDSYGNGANYKNSPDFNSIMMQMQQQQQQSKNARDGNDWDYTQSGQGRSFFM